MKRSQVFLALLLSAGVASAQQYVINTVVGIPGVRGYWGDGGAATSGQLNKPGSLTLDSKGNIYFSDYYTFVVRMVTASTDFLSTIAGNGANGYVNGSQTTANGGDISQVGFVHGIAVDGNGNVYISDTSNFVIRKIDTSMNTTTFAGANQRGYGGDGGAATSAQLWFPAGLALDKSGNLYVADYGSITVRKIDTSGKISTVAGTGSFGNSGDGGPANKAALGQPLSLAIDSAGNIFIGDTGNSNIREITPDGNIHTVISNVNAVSLAVDASDNLYFVDGVTPFVQKILTTGSVLVIAGNGETSYGGDGGQATLAPLDHPNGVAVDASGNVFFSDTDNEIIRKLTAVPFSVGAALNAASSVQQAIAPGEIVTLFGQGIGPATLTPFTVTNGFIDNQLAGVSVTFNGIPAPLIYVSSTLVAAVAPYELQGASTANIAVTYQGAISATTAVPVTSAAPGIFTANTTGLGQAAAVNQNGSLNSASNPAGRGSFISLYVTGEGQTLPSGIDGKIAVTPPYPRPMQPVTVTIGGVAATVTYAGGAPTAVAGLMQVNVQIPANAPTGAAVPVTVSVGQIAAQSGVTIAVN
jgi:uncharacterized protein (TIGR03437 family)